MSTPTTQPDSWQPWTAEMARKLGRLSTGDIQRRSYPREIHWGRVVRTDAGGTFRMAGRAGLVGVGHAGEETPFPRPRPDEVTTCHVGQCRAWECPECGHDALLYSVTENGFDWLFCPECTEWHRKPIAAGVDEALCQHCGVGVSALERRSGEGWTCVFCSAGGER